MNSSWKDVPEHRVCLIDYYPLLLKSLKDTVTFCKKYNIPFTTVGTNAGYTARLIYHHCLNEFLQTYKNTKSKYPKVLVYYPITDKKIKPVTKIVDKVFKLLPISWCKVSSFDSPDTVYAALRSCGKTDTSKNLKYFANKNQLKELLKIINKNAFFSSGTVDFTGDNE